MSSCCFAAYKEAKQIVQKYQNGFSLVAHNHRYVSFEDNGNGTGIIVAKLFLQDDKSRLLAEEIGHSMRLSFNDLKLQYVTI